MKFRNPWIDPRVAQVRSASARTYLFQHGWKLLSPESDSLLQFEGPFGGDVAPTVWLPVKEQARDYTQRVIELITDLALAEDRFAVEVLDDILQQSADPVPANGPSVSQPAEPAPK
jgi:hypothetical protein